MKISYTYHTTSTEETLESHVFVHMYSDPEIKKLMHEYKFNTALYTQKHADTRDVFMSQTIDMCIDRYLSVQTDGAKQLHIYTSPPSTMHERGEKKIDSMLHLLRTSVRKMVQYIHVPRYIHITAQKVFSMQQKHIKEKQAQHLGNNSTRRNRIKNLRERYNISRWHTIYMWYCIHVLHIQKFSYTIIDDVSSTGATLVACKQSLIEYLNSLKKKHTYINFKFDIEIISICH